VHFEVRIPPQLLDGDQNPSCGLRGAFFGATVRARCPDA
jgi:hypothetical protein